jgi:hypothetical protein
MIADLYELLLDRTFDPKSDHLSCLIELKRKLHELLCTDIIRPSDHCECMSCPLKRLGNRTEPGWRRFEQQNVVHVRPHP